MIAEIFSTSELGEGEKNTAQREPKTAPGGTNPRLVTMVD